MTEPKQPIEHSIDTRVVALGVFLVVLPVMSRLAGVQSAPNNASDYPDHLFFAAKLAGDWREVLPHPLLHVTLVILCAGNLAAMPGVAATLLSLMVALKVSLTISIVDSCRSRLGVDSGAIPWRRVVAVALLLTLAMPLPNWWKPGIVVGQPSPNVWHNPTTIFCMPIVLWLFPVAIRSIDSLRLGKSMS